MSTSEGSSRTETLKRKDYIDWEDYFMATAFLAAKRSKDPCTQVGACIVNNENIIVGVGYNGFPKGCDDDDFPWAKNYSSPLENKFFYGKNKLIAYKWADEVVAPVCHAEVNAILNKNSSDIKGCRMYVALFPCNECAKFIIQSGITEIIYMSFKNSKKLETIAAKRMFDAAGVRYRQLVPKCRKILIDFDEINWNSLSQLPPTPEKPHEKEMSRSSN